MSILQSSHGVRLRLGTSDRSDVVGLADAGWANRRWQPQPMQGDRHANQKEEGHEGGRGRGPGPGGGGFVRGHGAGQAGSHHEGAWPDREGRAGRGQDLCAHGQARRVRRLLVRRPVGPGDGLCHPVHAHSEVHRRVHAGAVAGLWLRRRIEGGAGAGPHQRQGHQVRRHAPSGHFGDERRV